MMDISERTVTKELYCSNCWRKDRHVAVGSRAGSLVWMILTLGLAYFFQPFRCTTCGHERIRGFGE